MAQTFSPALLSTGQNTKLFTVLIVIASKSQKIKRNNPNFVEEDLAFYAYGAGSNLGTPIDRFQNSLVPGTYFYANEAEQTLLGNRSHVEAGLAFEVGI
ncbi:hypothetical protein NIES593_11525 [Hydrococcus rivularis NIES-593]|uniref:Uncharacterized protein n=1 Tax=Hydrococcus rivularis NIES-593 TaxID=1921803 RepID=A0A1U7HGN9_9CYAN|nr:hypothetical protein [Hydrococcus rivularis]OKH22753.1 hypothetical protein NIES593_11525 [Hydrococcus rivularis NIES-593]